jgi:hypothetical protein
MNYIISSIVLLAMIMIIIYILSINNNVDKLKNKLKELFIVAKSKKINYLNDRDRTNLLNYVKQHFNSNDNVTIPSKVYYNKTDRGYEMNDINIICYKYNNNSFIEIPYKINILFVPFEKDNYISNQTLFNYHGNYMINVIEPKKPNVSKETNVKTVHFNNNDTFIPQINNNQDTQETYTDVLDMIPDIIHLSEDNSPIDTTDTEQLISHNLK